jgi:hypothetical protein
MITLLELMVCDSLIITKSVDNGMKFGEEMPDSRLTEKSDDKLEIEDGKIIISEKGEGKKTDGTKLIRELINSKEVIHIVLSEESYNHYNPNDSLYGKVVTWDNKNYYNYYPIYKENAGLVREEKTNSEILLAHELIYAYHDINGTYKGDHDLNLNFEIYLCDRTKWTSNPSKEERNTVFGPGISENSIRKELGFNIRGVY